MKPLSLLADGGTNLCPPSIPLGTISNIQEGTKYSIDSTLFSKRQNFEAELHNPDSVQFFEVTNSQYRYRDASKSPTHTIYSYPQHINSYKFGGNGSVTIVDSNGRCFFTFIDYTTSKKLGDQLQGAGYSEGGAGFPSVGAGSPLLVEFLKQGGSEDKEKNARFGVLRTRNDLAFV